MGRTADPRTFADLLPVLLWATDAEGRRWYLNAAFLEFRGRTLDEELGMGWAQGVHPDDAPTYLARYRRAIARRESFELTYRFRRHDGAYRWMLARGRPMHDGAEYLGHLGATLDITERVQAETALREHRDALRLALSAAGMGTWTWRAGDDVVVWDRRLRELFDVPDEEPIGGFDGWFARVHADDRTAVAAVIDEAFRTKAAYQFDHRVVRRDGSVRWLESRGEVFEDGDGEVGGTRGVSVDVTDRKLADAALARAQARLSVLAEAGSVLGSSLDLEDTLRGLAGVVVGTASDGCEIVIDDGTRMRRFVAMRDRSRGALREVAPIPADRRHPIRRVLSSGETYVLRFSEDPDAFGPPDVPSSARALGLRAAVIVPIRLRTSGSGVLALSWTHEPDDLDERRSIAEDLAVRSGLAIDNARLFEAQRLQSIELQRALLPDDLAVPAGYELAARYHPGAAGSEVGGDWYDAVVGAGDRLHLSVGDVVGKGVPAAAAMVKIRTSLRTAMLTHPPDHALSLLAELDVVTRAGFVTVLAATLHPSGVLSAASAGHLPPVLVTPAGDAWLLPVAPGPPLGLAGPRSHPVSDHRLEPGSRLILFTDGLIERRDVDIDAGLDQLVAAAQRTARLSIEAMVDEVMAQLVDDSGEDDAALIAVGIPSNGRRVTAHEPAGRTRTS